MCHGVSRGCDDVNDNDDHDAKRAPQIQETEDLIEVKVEIDVIHSTLLRSTQKARDVEALVPRIKGSLWKPRLTPALPRQKITTQS